MELKERPAFLPLPGVTYRSQVFACLRCKLAWLAVQASRNGSIETIPPDLWTCPSCGGERGIELELVGEGPTGEDWSVFYSSMARRPPNAP